MPSVTYKTSFPTSFPQANQPEISPERPIPKRYRGYGMLAGPEPSMERERVSVPTQAMSRGKWGYRVCPEFVWCQRGNGGMDVDCERSKPSLTQDIIIDCPVYRHQMSLGRGEENKTHLEMVEVDRHE